MIQQATDVDQPSLTNVVNIWDPLEATVFFVQETFLNILYIWQTRNLLRNSALLGRSFRSEASSTLQVLARKRILHQLIYTNLLVIVLDIALLGIRYADLFYLQGAFKPCVYAVKLKVEFVILNSLIKSMQAQGEPTVTGQASAAGSGKGGWRSRMVKSSAERGEEEEVPIHNLHINALSVGQTRGLNSQESEYPIIDRQGRAVLGSNNVGTGW